MYSLSIWDNADIPHDLREELVAKLAKKVTKPNVAIGEASTFFQCQAGCFEFNCFLLYQAKKFFAGAKNNISAICYIKVFFKEL